MTDKIDFSKAHDNRINLAKKIVLEKGLSTQKAQVIGVIDISLSMSPLFIKGTVQKVFDKILPLAMQFDDDGNIDIFLFHWLGFFKRTPFTLSNRKNFILKEVIIKHFLNSFLFGFATLYSPILKKICKKYLSDEEPDVPLFVIFFTDGDCSDKKMSEKILIESSKRNIFWKFIGLGGSKEGFSFLNKIDNLENRDTDNTNFIHIKDIENIDDNKLYNLLLNEFPEWLKEKNKST